MALPIYKSLVSEEELDDQALGSGALPGRSASVSPLSQASIPGSSQAAGALPAESAASKQGAGPILGAGLTDLSTETEALTGVKPGVDFRAPTTFAENYLMGVDPTFQQRFFKPGSSDRYTGTFVNTYRVVNGKMVPIEATPTDIAKGDVIFYVGGAPGADYAGESRVGQAYMIKNGQLSPVGQASQYKSPEKTPFFKEFLLEGVLPMVLAAAGPAGLFEGLGGALSGGALTGASASSLGSSAFNLVTQLAAGRDPVDALRSTALSYGAGQLANQLGSMLPQDLGSVGRQAITQLVTTGKIDPLSLATTAGIEYASDVLAQETGLSKASAGQLIRSGMQFAQGNTTGALTSLVRSGVTSGQNSLTPTGGLADYGDLNTQGQQLGANEIALAAKAFIDSKNAGASDDDAFFAATEIDPRIALQGVGGSNLDPYLYREKSGEFLQTQATADPNFVSSMNQLFTNKEPATLTDAIQLFRNTGYSIEQVHDWMVTNGIFDSQKATDILTGMFGSPSDEVITNNQGLVSGAGTDITATTPAAQDTLKTLGGILGLGSEDPDAVYRTLFGGSLGTQGDVAVLGLDQLSNLRDQIEIILDDPELPDDAREEISKMLASVASQEDAARTAASTSVQEDITAAAQLAAAQAASSASDSSASTQGGASDAESSLDASLSSSTAGSQPSSAGATSQPSGAEAGVPVISGDLEKGVKTGDEGVSGVSGVTTDEGFSGFSGKSGVSGFSGFSGDSGSSGFSGLSGTSGISGFSGISGKSGASGFSGVSGESGGSGFSGFSGESGISGFSGFSGESGISGWSGVSGESGASGFSGMSGESGASGFSGFSGESGASGFSGYSGLAGESGFSGVSGESGASGFSGFSGESGASGFSGASGVSGISGFSGFSGVSGESGSSGFSGTSGLSGFSGTSGVSGTSGFSGFSGVSGVSGVSGFSGFSGRDGRDGKSVVSAAKSLPAFLLDSELQMLKSSGDTSMKNPLEALIKRVEEMNQIDPALLAVMSQRMNIQPPQAPTYTYGEESAIEDILGLRQPKVEEPLYAEGGYVEPLRAKPMNLQFMNEGGALGRENFKGGKHVAGEGDGQSDDIPAWLADGEFVFPADVVSALGNGSTKAGTDKLYEMMHQIRARARSTKVKDLPPPAHKSPLDYLKKGK